MTELFRSIFSAANWHIGSTIFGVIFAFALIAKNDVQLLRGSKSRMLAWLLAIFVTLYIGTRPLGCYVDTKLYTEIYDLLKRGVWESNRGHANEPFWEFVEDTCLPIMDASGWLTVIAIFYIGGMTFAARRWMPDHFLMALVFLFTSFSFFSYGTNGIRNGMATSIAMLGISLFNDDKKRLIIGYILLFIACLTHKSCMLIFAAATAARYFRDTKVNVIIWICCIILSLLFAETLKELMASLMNDERSTSYITQDISVDDSKFSRTGFRWDFILYSSVPILLGWYATTTRKIQDNTYLFILSTYIFANCVWCLINSVAYSNRFAYLSWFLYPIAIAYPLAKLKIFNGQGAIAGAMLLFFIAFNWII